MLKKDLVAKIAEMTGMSKKDVASVIDTMVKVVVDTVANGEAVLLTGFGQWFGRIAEPRNVNLQGFTGKTKRAPYPKFKPGKAFKETVKKAPVSKFE
jgi:DNA-binding protein HU-beta